MVKDTVLYDRLQVSTTATESEIKKAYHKLSLVHHPDKNTDENKEEATKKFSELNQAKNVLLDSQKRSMYDQVGMEMFSNNTDGTPSGMPGGFPFGMPGGFPFGMPGGFPFGMGGEPAEKPLEPVVHHQHVSLEQVYSEEFIQIEYEYQSSCKKCNGEGTKSGKKILCGMCQGSGKRVVVMQRGNMIQQMVSDCPNCNGKGSEKNPADNCGSCTNGTITKKKTHRLQLECQFRDGHHITIKDMGHHSKNQYSDLIIVFHLLPNSRFFLHRDDLFTTVCISLYQAMYGFQYVLYHMDERKLLIHSLTPTACNEIKCIANEGMSRNGSTLFIIFDVILPTPRPMSDFTTKLRIWDEDELRQSTQNELKLMMDPSVQAVTMSSIQEEQHIQFLSLFYQLKVKSTQPNEEHHNEQHYRQQVPQGQPQCVQQ
jgi:DnaJ family protein A protein 2